jgi:hypothetical protein
MKLAFAALAMVAASASVAAAQPIPVPSDPRARYEAVSVDKRRDGLVEIITRRQGPSGTSFARREVDCRQRLFRYIGEGDTLEQAKRPAPNWSEPLRLDPLGQNSATCRTSWRSNSSGER